jgi:chromosome segregation ATPase
MPAPKLHSAFLRALCLLLASVIGISLHGALPDNVIADLRAKAASGNAIAQYNLGIAYADASDPVSDLSEAYAWLTLAAERGSNQAALNALLPRLSSAQLTEGKRRLEEKRAQIARAAEQSPFVTPGNQSGTAQPPSDPEIDTLRAEKSRLTTELSAARREAEASKTASIAKVAELNRQIAERDRTISSLKASSPSVPAAVPPAAPDPALETALKESEAARASLARDLAALSTEITALKSQLTSEQRARAQLAAETLAKGDQTAELAAARSQVSSLGTELESLKRGITARDESIARLNDDSQRLAGELAAAKLAATSSSEITRLKSDLDAARTALASVEKERDELKLAPLPAPAASPEEFDRLRKQLTDSESKLNTALRSYTLQQKEIETAQNTIASLTEEKNGLTGKLELADCRKRPHSRRMSQLRHPSLQRSGIFVISCGMRSRRRLPWRLRSIS